MTSSRFFLSVAAAMSFSASAGLAQLAHAQGVPAPTGSRADVSGVCTPTKLAFKTLTNLKSTTSASFVPMPGTQRTIKTSANSCIIVAFSGEVTADFQNQMEIRAFASSLVGEPPFLRMGRSVSPSNLEARSMRFVFKDVPAGTHNVGIAWRSEKGGADVGGTVYARNRTLIIRYR
jgi:hypothetical protein